MLFEAIKTSDEDKIRDWSKDEAWATVEELIKSQGVENSTISHNTIPWQIFHALTCYIMSHHIVSHTLQQILLQQQVVTSLQMTSHNKPDELDSRN